MFWVNHESAYWLHRTNTRYYGVFPPLPFRFYLRPHSLKRVIRNLSENGLNTDVLFGETFAEPNLVSLVIQYRRGHLNHFPFIEDQAFVVGGERKIEILIIVIVYLVGVSLWDDMISFLIFVLDFVLEELLGNVDLKLLI